MPQDARNKLRQMGGITAAFPEMVQAQQRFDNGGIATAPVERGAPVDGSFFRDLIQGTGEAFLRPITTTGRDALDTVAGGVVGAANIPVAATAGLAGVAGDFLGAEDFASRMYDQARNTYDAGRLLAGEGYFDAQRYRPSDLGEGLRAARESAARREKSEPAREEQIKAIEALNKTLEMYGPGSEGGPTRPEARPGTRPRARPDDIAARATELLNIPTDDTGDGDAPAAPTLRERYDEQLALLKEVFGEDDNAAARDKAMTLAMVGLAALAGPKGQTLRNMAEGAIVGLGMAGKRRERQREREQEFKTLAMQGALAELDADRRERLQKEMFDLEAQLRRELQTNELVAESLGDTGVSAPTGSAVLNYLSRLTETLLETGQAETFEEASRMAREELVRQFPELRVPETETPTPGLPDDLTPEERDLLSGG